MVLMARAFTGIMSAVGPREVTVAATGVVPSIRAKLVVMVVNGSIASLKTAAIFLLTATAAAAFAGSVKLTVGAVMSGAAPVVKLHVKVLANGLPARSLASVVIVAV